MNAPLKIELLSDVCHAATRLQSAAMIHAADAREFLPGDSIEHLQRQAAGIVALTEQLAFKVAQLRDSAGQCFARPRLMESIELESRCRPEAERFELQLTDSEGGDCA